MSKLIICVALMLPTAAKAHCYDGRDLLTLTEFIEAMVTGDWGCGE